MLDEQPPQARSRVLTPAQVEALRKGREIRHQRQANGEPPKPQHGLANFDRELNVFRDKVAIANLTLRQAVERYIAMMAAIDTAFALFYADMTSEEQARLVAAFTKLAHTVALFVEPNGRTE